MPSLRICPGIHIGHKKLKIELNCPFNGLTDSRSDEGEDLPSDNPYVDSQAVRAKE